MTFAPVASLPGAGLAVAAFLASALALAIFGVALYLATPKPDRLATLLCVTATLPMCGVAYFLVRMPLDQTLSTLPGPTSELLFWIRTAYAPLTEEPAKLWPLLIPALRRRVDASTAGRYGLALGLGFALGEIFVVASLLIMKRPDVASLPWYELGGFIGERFMTVAIHGAMTASCLYVWRRFETFAGGLAVAMTLHYLANFPIAAAQRGWLGEPATGLAIASMWVGICFFVAIVFLVSLRFGGDLGRAVFGRTVCPRCGVEFDRTLVGFNFGPSVRYEPCPHCGRWSWTRRLPSAPSWPAPGPQREEP